MAKGFYLNDIPLDIFLDYFNETNSKENIKNEMVFDISNVFVYGHVTNGNNIKHIKKIKKKDENPEYSYFKITKNENIFNVETVNNEEEMKKPDIPMISEDPSNIGTIKLILLFLKGFSFSDIISDKILLGYTGDSEGNINTAYIKIEDGDFKVPRLSKSGKNVYKTENGLFTLEPNRTNNFYTHQKILRNTFNNINEKNKWVYKVNPYKVVLIKENNEEKFKYYTKYQKTLTYKDITENIPTDVNIIEEHLPESIIGTTKTENYYFEKEVLNIRKLPVNKIFLSNRESKDAIRQIKIGSYKLPENKLYIGNCILEVYSRNTSLKGSEDSFEVYKDDSVLISTTNKNNLTEEYKIKISNANSASPFLLIPFKKLNRTQELTLYFENNISTKIKIDIFSDITSDFSDIVLLNADDEDIIKNKDIILTYKDLHPNFKSISNDECSYLKVPIKKLNETKINELLCNIDSNRNVKKIEVSIDDPNDDMETEEKDDMKTEEKVYYYENYYAEGCIKVIEKTSKIKSTIDKSALNKNEIEILPTLSNNLQSTLEKERLYFDMDNILYRGKFVGDNSFFNQRCNALENTLEKILESNSDDDFLKEEYNNGNSFLNIYNFSKAVNSFIENDVELSQRKIPQDNDEKISIKDFNYKFILEEIPEKSIPSKNNVAEPIFNNFSDDRSLIERLRDYKKFPMQFIYLKKQAHLNTFDFLDNDFTIVNNINMYPLETQINKIDYLKMFNEDSYEMILDRYLNQLVEYGKTNNNIYKENISLNLGISTTIPYYDLFFSSKISMLSNLEGINKQLSNDITKKHVLNANLEIDGNVFEKIKTGKWRFINA